MQIIIRDNYLPQQTFSLLYTHYQKVQLKKGVEREFFSSDPTPEIAKFINYFDKKREYNQLGKFIHTAATPPNFVHPKHYEAEFKIMSAIIYIGPEKAPGTTFYINGKEETIEWKPNRLMIFCGETDVTWHDYKSADQMRFTYNYFLVDPTKIQNESYKNNIIRM
jgi:hypothetical protein